MYKTLAENFWRDGYLVLENFFSDELMDQMHSEILNHYGMQPEFEHNQEFLDLAATEVVPWFPQNDGNIVFDEIDRDGRFLKLSEEILGKEWQSLYCMTMFSKKGTLGQAWHQDCEPEDATTFNLNRLVYTHDISEDLGGQTLVVPGSHKRGLITVGDVDENFTDQVVLSPKKGTLVLLHGHTWHRVLPVKGEYRVSTNYRSIPQGVSAGVTDICVYRNMRYKFETSEVVERRL